MPPAAVSARSRSGRRAGSRRRPPGHRSAARHWSGLLRCRYSCSTRRRACGCARASCARRLPVAERRVELLEADQRVADDRQARCLTASKRAALSEMKCASRGERRPGAGGEVLQPRADGEDHVGLGGQLVGRVDAPMMPIGPTFSGWSWSSTVRPAMVSATGMPCFSAKSASSPRRANSARRRRR